MFAFFLKFIVSFVIGLAGMCLWSWVKGRTAPNLTTNNEEEVAFLLPSEYVHSQLRNYGRPLVVSRVVSRARDLPAIRVIRGIKPLTRHHRSIELVAMETEAEMWERIACRIRPPSPASYYGYYGRRGNESVRRVVDMGSVPNQWTGTTMADAIVKEEQEEAMWDAKVSQNAYVFDWDGRVTHPWVNTTAQMRYCFRFPSQKDVGTW